MVEQVLLHEAAVALGMVGGQTLVLVQIHGADPGEVDKPRLFTGDQLPVQGNRGGAGGQAQHAGGLGADQLLKTVSGQTGGVLRRPGLENVEVQHDLSPF